MITNNQFTRNLGSGAFGIPSQRSINRFHAEFWEILKTYKFLSH